MRQRAKLLKSKKEEGNESFKNGRFQEAFDTYTSALAIDANNRTTNAKLYFNRAVVLVKVFLSILFSLHFPFFFGTLDRSWNGRRNVPSC